MYNVTWKKEKQDVYAVWFQWRETIYTQKKDLEALQQNSSNGSLWDVFTIISCESEEMHHFFFLKLVYGFSSY